MKTPNMNDILLKNSASEWLYFQNPEKIVIATEIDEVMPALAEIERETNAGKFAAGFLTYEASSAFDTALQTHKSKKLPLLWFGIFDKPISISDTDFSQTKIEQNTNWELNVSKEEYLQQIRTIKEFIGAGDTYQVNHTIRLKNDKFKQDAWPFFLNTFASLDSQFSAFLETDDFAIASGSPELFFEQNGKKIICRPMKGTRPRRPLFDEDLANRDELKNSAKDRSENVMIVDMIRNDLSLIAEKGSVKPTKLFEVEQFATVWQMTSTVEAMTNATIPEIFTALFPCASITGAPKVRTMQIINELENSERGVYTGCIGYIEPNKKARFSVAIRTVSIDKKNRTAEYGIGSGVVWNSNPEEEFTECKTKAISLLSPRQHFQLLETMIFEPKNGIYLLNEHLNRLEKAARYFNFKYPESEIVNALKNLSFDEFARLRLRVWRDGSFKIESTPIGKTKPQTETPWRIAFAKTAISKNDPFLYYKTTNRAVYENAKSEMSEADDVVLFNENGEITETTIANIVIEKSGQKFTPPQSCGLLDGTLRQHLIEAGEISEKVITIDELKSTEKIWLINSVRGWIPAKLMDL